VRVARRSAGRSTPTERAIRLAHSFAEAAHRLVGTFTDSDPDDALLMPFL